MLFSCENKMEKFNKDLSESWSIEEISIQNKNSLDSLNYNVISFNFPNQGDIYIPRSFGFDGMHSRFSLQLKKDVFEIKIDSKNEVFNGIFVSKILVKEAGWMELILESDKLNLKAHARDITYGL